jgi:hypothetical protein
MLMLKRLIVRSAYLILASTFIVTGLCSTVKAQAPIETFKKLQWPFYDPGTGDSCSDSSTDSTGAPLTGRDNVQKTWNYFTAKGLTEKQVAGIMGNIKQESTFDPQRIEGGGRSKNPDDAGSGGYGLVQWTPGHTIITTADANHISGPIYALGTQLDLVWAQMNGTAPNGSQNMIEGLKKLNDEVAVASYFDIHFESGTDPGGTGPPPTHAGPGGIREKYATDILATYGGSGSGNASSSTDTSAGCAAATATCTNGSGDNSASELSATRQNVVCIAQKELTLWESKPGYPHPAYSQNGYLKYSQGRKEEWCADFASWVYNQATYPLQDSPSWNIAYVPNIQAVGEQGGKFHWHTKSSNYTPKPGDLAIHGANHVNIYISTTSGRAHYIGGDQGSGPYPGGSIVSIETGNGYYDNGITGYVTPD